MKKELERYDDFTQEEDAGEGVFFSAAFRELQLEIYLAKPSKRR